ncbi:MAG: amidohydrolase family protein [Thermomicrobiales bacterium]|nr:amidohydrolase family protein [Thermomicrobiales bacterium]
MTATLITNGRIMDGTGNPWFYADVLLDGEEIAAIEPPGSISPERAEHSIDATGLVVSPGFIDIQSHSILPLLLDGRSLSKVTQGVTTEIMGEFWTPAPFGGRIVDPWAIALVHRLEGDEKAKWDEQARGWTRFGHWLRDLENHGVSVNIGSFVGGGTIREYGMGQMQGDAGPDELAVMRAATAEAMEDGAFGVATALIYPPGSYAATAELTAIMEVVAAYNGIHITHMRSEGERILSALEETLKIGIDSGVITEIYHLKAAGRPSWHHMPAVIDHITAARAQGIDVAADMYPYRGSGTGLAASVPQWAAEGGLLLRNLDDPIVSRRMLDEMDEALVNPQSEFEHMADRAGAENVLLAEFANPELAERYTGRTLVEVATDLNMPMNETILWLLRNDRSQIFTMYLGMSEDNLQLQFQQEWIKWGTDAGGVDPSWMKPRGLVHPRAYGTYPRILGHYTRDLGWLRPEDAVRKGTSAVAERLGLRDRGTLRAGMKADVITWNPATIIDKAEYTDPHHLSEGVLDVWVNGTHVLADGAHTGATPGQRVCGPGAK